MLPSQLSERSNAIKCMVAGRLLIVITPELKSHMINSNFYTLLKLSLKRNLDNSSKYRLLK
jgi:hypothetical protein